MIGLTALFVVFTASGLFLLRRRRAPRRECWVFGVIAFLGYVMWGSLLLKVPLDLNRAIAWSIRLLFWYSTP